MPAPLTVAFALVLGVGGEPSTFEAVSAACAPYGMGRISAGTAIETLTQAGFVAVTPSTQAPLKEFVLGTGDQPRDRLFLLDEADALDGRTGGRLCLYYPGDRDRDAIVNSVLTLAPPAPAGMVRQPVREGAGWMYGDSDLRLIIRVPPTNPPQAAFTGGR